jgi:hypothetical protein
METGCLSLDLWVCLGLLGNSLRTKSGQKDRRLVYCTLMHEIVGHLYDETQRKLTNAENQNRQMRLTRWRLTLFVSFGFP